MRSQWRIRTRFRQVVLRVGRPGGGAPQEGNAALLADLLFELQQRDTEAAQVVDEIRLALHDLGDPSPFAKRPGRDDLRRSLERALRHGQLFIEEAQVPLVPPLPEPPEDQPEPFPSSDADLTFIAIEVRDQDGKLVRDRRYRIELPDGEVHEGLTGFDGKARVDGIVQGGTATVTLPPPDAGSTPPPAPEPEPEVVPIEIDLYDFEGQPLGGAAFRIVFDDGVIHSGHADKDGHIRIADNTRAGDAKLILDDFEFEGQT